MTARVQLIGLDFGTTTSSAVIASACLRRNAVTGRSDLDDVVLQHVSGKVFTPFAGELLDEPQLEAHLDTWLRSVDPRQVFGGGALLTGLAARAANADAVIRLVRRRIGDALVARADDPCLEAWLAFMGSCAELSRAQPEANVLNLDIGGGTTNLALGRAGRVMRTGCLFVGARHFQVEPGSYRLVRLSRPGEGLLHHLGIHRHCGDVLDPADVKAIIDFQVALLAAAVRGENPVHEIAQLHTQVPFRLRADIGAVDVTLSGGVGELVYTALQGSGWPQTTAFGDLGIDLAQRLLASPLFATHLHRHAPDAGGRATVYGLLRHSTEVSGRTVFLSDPALLPLVDVPILGTIDDRCSDEELEHLLGLAARPKPGACLRICLASPGSAAVGELGRRLCMLLHQTGFPAQRPLVLMVAHNLGKALGHYITAWGAEPRALVVLDEIDVPDAQYVHIGRPHEQAIPVSFYGLRP